MTSLESMTQKLEPLGIYSFTQGGELERELTVYAAELDRLWSTLDALEREYFIQTAEDFGLSLRERFTGRERTDLSVQARRALLMQAQRRLGGDGTRSGFEAFLEGLGLSDFTVGEVFSTGRVNIRIGDELTDVRKSAVEYAIAEEVPVHCTVHITYGQ